MTWLKRLFRPCAHQWEVYERFDLLFRDNNDQHGVLYALRCKHCGDIRKREVRL